MLHTCIVVHIGSQWSSNDFIEEPLIAQIARLEIREAIEYE
jgi:hypothetical protein